MKSEIKAIKSEIQKPIFEETAKPQNEQSGMKVLGELLTYLRKEKLMSMLMLCRQISKIELDGQVAIIYSDDNDMLALQTNEKYFSEISKFFESKGLSFKVNEIKKDTKNLDELKRLLGKKLIIK